MCACVRVNHIVYLVFLFQHWQENSDESVVVMVMGNKTDIESDVNGRILTDQGRTLADVSVWAVALSM